MGRQLQAWRLQQKWQLELTDRFYADFTFLGLKLMLELQVMLELDITRIIHNELNGFIKELCRDQTVTSKYGTRSN